VIPKIIHYCWFGEREIPDSDKKNIEGWKRLNPKYQIMFWNEDNYDIQNSKNIYMKQAYEAKKLGFVPDYVRTNIIYRYGGFYFDTDVELLKPLDSLLDYKCIMGFQDKDFVNHGHGFAAEPQHPLIKGILDVYEHLRFINEDGSLNLIPSPVYLSDYLETQGLTRNNQKQYIGDAIIFPSEYFCPIDYVSRTSQITNNTYGIHHYAESWHNGLERTTNNIEKFFKENFGEKLGDLMGRIFSFPFRILNKFQQLGAKGTIRFIVYKIQREKNT
jgi:hypothetical protein